MSNIHQDWLYLLICLTPLLLPNMITKTELLHAFRSRNTKRRDALYCFYQAWFALPLTADMLAERISADLGIPIGASIIYHIRSKHKPPRQLATPAMKGVTNQPVFPTPVLAVPDLETFDHKQSSIEFLTD